MDSPSVTLGSQPSALPQVTDAARPALPFSLPETLQLDADLAAVVTAWPGLSEPIRLAVLALCGRLKGTTRDRAGGRAGR
jgi:hypothetical protein